MEKFEKKQNINPQRALEKLSKIDKLPNNKQIFELINNQFLVKFLQNLENKTSNYQEKNGKTLEGINAIITKNQTIRMILENAKSINLPSVKILNELIAILKDDTRREELVNNKNLQYNFLLVQKYLNDYEKPFNHYNLMKKQSPKIESLLKIKEIMSEIPNIFEDLKIKDSKNQMN